MNEVLIINAEHQPLTDHQPLVNVLGMRMVVACSCMAQLLTMLLVIDPGLLKCATSRSTAGYANSIM